MAFALGPQARQKLAQWMHFFKFHKAFQSTDVKHQLAQQKPQENPSNKFYLLLLKHIGNLKIPSQSGEAQPNIGNQETNKTYYLQMNVTLHNPKTGFFGRTYKGKALKLRFNAEANELVSDDQDWVLFYTSTEAVETKAVVEAILIEEDPNRKRKLHGLGYSIVPLFLDDLPLQVELLKGSPRDLMRNYNTGASPQLTGSHLYFNFKLQQKKFDSLMALLPENAVIGHNDELPGVQGSKLPVQPDEIFTTCQVVSMETIYAHNIRVSSMNEVEQAFNQFLKDWQKYGSEEIIGSNAEIVERKLTVAPHNSWRQIGSQSFVSLNKEFNGVVQSSGAIKILNFLMHPLIALVFKLETNDGFYTVKYISKSGRHETKDFVLGWCPYIPTLVNSGDKLKLKDEEVQLDLILGPGMTILGDVLWDQSLVRQQRRLFVQPTFPHRFVKMGVMLTQSEDMVSEQDKRYQEELLMKQAQETVKKQIDNLDEEKGKEQLRLQLMQEENEKLRKEKQELEQQSKKPPEELLKKTEDNQEIEKAKEYYTNKNDEIGQLISQVMKNQNSEHGLQLPQAVVDQGEESVASLLRFLIQIVLQNYGPEENNMNSESKQEMTKKNLMELLKSDSSYKMNVFGASGGMNVLHSKELSRQDKINLLRLGVGKNLLDPETEAKLMASEPRMEVELQDIYKASTISFKFVAYKTPITLCSDIAIPSRIYFTFKFFTFKTVQTEKVIMKLPPELEQKQSQQNQSQLNANHKIKLGTQYYLTKLSSLQQQDSQTLSSNAIEKGLKTIFDIDPSVSNINDENLHLANYLKDKVLTVDLWNGDSLMHFGTTKIPLHILLRQADPTKVIGQEFDICEPENGQYIGGLQLLLTNEGRKVPLSEQELNKSNQNLHQSPQKDRKLQPTQSTVKHKKKIMSKPIDSSLSAKESQLTSLAQAYEFQKSNVSTAYQSEEARKKLRVERLKRSAAATQNVSQLSLSDPSANDWQKQQTLKQIELQRENNKHSILNKVLKESMAFKQQIEVIPGQATLIHFLVQNPFSQDDVFQILVDDPDHRVISYPELTVVHNEQKEWQFWFNQGKCAKPADWDAVSSKSDLILSPGQQCPLLLKFMSFREPVSEGSQKEQGRGSSHELRARKIKVTLISRDQMPISTMEVKIVPREQYCDQIFRFYEPQNIKAFVKIPQFVPFGLQGMTVVSSNKEMKADINQNGEVQVFLQSERAPRHSECYLYLYQDHFNSQLLACCKVEVYALQCIRQKIQAGPEITYQLQVLSREKRTIEVFSSNPRLIFPPGKKERNLQIIQPNEMSIINIGVKASVAGTQRVRIHCVDINTKELVQAWIFEIEADKPLLQKAYQIQIVAGRPTPYKFPFTNPLKESATLEFVSSKPNIMQIRRERYAFEANENKQIDLFFPPASKASHQEAILYVNDESGKVSESLLFKITVRE